MFYVFQYRFSIFLHYFQLNLLVLSLNKYISVPVVEVTRWYFNERHYYSVDLILLNCTNEKTESCSENKSKIEFQKVLRTVTIVVNPIQNNRVLCSFSIVCRHIDNVSAVNKSPRSIWKCRPFVEYWMIIKLIQVLETVRIERHTVYFSDTKKLNRNYLFYEVGKNLIDTFNIDGKNRKKETWNRATSNTRNHRVRVSSVTEQTGKSDFGQLYRTKEIPPLATLIANAKEVQPEQLKEEMFYLFTYLSIHPSIRLSIYNSI